MDCDEWQLRDEIKNKRDSLNKRQPLEIARCLFLNFSQHICPGSECTFCWAHTTAGRLWRTRLLRWCALPPPTRSWGSPGSGEGQPAVLSLSGTRRSLLVPSQAKRGRWGSNWISLAASQFLKIPHLSNGASWKVAETVFLLVALPRLRWKMNWFCNLSAA